jgi:predicted unusual protein kinase regulating ubiquinone biosynthesis (AarF/ABC1/UbiB family)
MKEQESIPSSKVQRAVKFIATGAKIGGNYVKHYAKKAIHPETDRTELHENNAADVYETLSELKGSALKVAQMLSMDRNMLPNAYRQKFQMAQYQAPPLSGPLIVRTFQKEFGKSPSEMFDAFEMKSVNAASIGQVHKAVKDGKTLAVKIQYPGVAESIKSDLKLVKPIALRMVGMSEREMDKYIREVEGKLLEETDYELELKRSQHISSVCADIPYTQFPAYYPEFSGKKVLTMDWMPGMHLNEFLRTNPSQEVRNRIGQALWDFYDVQIHRLKAVHADPHPGNFLMQPDGTLGIIDFGCVKEIPTDIYYSYFALTLPEVQNNPALVEQISKSLEVIYDHDGATEKALFLDLFMRMTRLTSRPFQSSVFDFSDSDFITEIHKLGEEIGNLKEFRNSKQGRGSQHTLYINRTFFGLYQILNDLKAVVNSGIGEWKTDITQHYQLDKSHA